jgi:hypothetical protein
MQAGRAGAEVRNGSELHAKTHQEEPFLLYNSSYNTHLPHPRSVPSLNKPIPDAPLWATTFLIAPSSLAERNRCVTSSLMLNAKDLISLQTRPLRASYMW